MRQGFRFKQFTVHDDQCQMKVGTDGVLLGAWVNVGKAQKILDIGTGSGVIALMLAQRSGDDTLIDAVEPSVPDAQQAAQNVSVSPWHHRISIHACTIQDFRSNALYDLIISNPPYFSASLLPPTEGRANARHTTALSHSELLASSVRVLGADGKLAVILPASEGNAFIHEAQQAGLVVVRSLAFYTRRKKPQERWLFELARHGQARPPEELCLYDEGDVWSAPYADLVRSFYIRDFSSGAHQQ